MLPHPVHAYMNPSPDHTPSLTLAHINIQTGQSCAADCLHWPDENGNVLHLDAVVNRT